MRLAKELPQYPPPPPATQSPAPQSSPAYTPQLQIGVSAIDLQACTVKEAIQSNASQKHFTDPSRAAASRTCHFVVFANVLGEVPGGMEFCLLLKSHVRLNAP